MNKPTSFGQPLPRKPKQLLKSNTQQLSLKININSRTPTLKVINHPINIQSGFNSRETQSYVNSPQHRVEEVKSIRQSPTYKEKLEIQGLLKDSLKKFIFEKQELEKIKEIANTWKESRKKKLQEYNAQTRNENKLKFKCEAFRPRSAWGSPEIKEPSRDSKHVCSKYSACTSVERRANIGLEYYNLKSPRNSTPKILVENISSNAKPNCEENVEKPKKQEEKKEIIEFIQKKRKERKKTQKKLKEKEEEEEFKRISQLVKVDRVAKKILKKVKKPKKSLKRKGNPLKKCKSKKNLQESYNELGRITQGDGCYSEDEEVINIMQVRKLATPEQNTREGRECLIFGNFSNQHSKSDVNITEIANKVLQKRFKPEDPSIIISLSMPIIELKSISDDSSSDISEQKHSLKKQLSSLKERIEKAKDLADKSYNEVALDLDIGIHKLVDFIKDKYLLGTFLSIKNSDKSKINYVETPQLSGVGGSKLQGPNSKQSSLGAKKEELEAMLSNLARNPNKGSREGSEDMEKLWENIEFVSKTTEFLQNADPLPNLPPIDEDKSLKTPSKSSSKPSNEASANSIIDQLGKVHFPSVEYLSFGNIAEATYEDLIDSPSLLSIASNTSHENSLSFIVFSTPNMPCEAPIFEKDPAKPIIPSVIPRPNAILIEDGGFSASASGSVNEFTLAVKENSSIATPEAEEIDEFSSIDFDFNFQKGKKPTQQEISMNPFSVSEETLELDEEEIAEKVCMCLSQWYFLEELHGEVYEEFKRNNYQLLGNAKLTLHEIDVRTGGSAVLGFVEKIWACLIRDENECVESLSRTQEFFLRELDRVNQRPVVEEGQIIPEGVLGMAESPGEFSMSLSIGEPISQYVKIHNQMVFDCVNEELGEICNRLNTPPWRKGGLGVVGVNLGDIFEEIKAEIRKNCGVGAGRIPSIGMIAANGALDDLLLQKIRENGLAALLAIDVEEFENKWTDYEKEELQTENEVADCILEILVNEIMQIINL